ncbi:DUF4142 domain-containing protein [Pontibacter sp. KCTC 32443]|uniref:DUF4142 domain-containing protein n=1 Tax=Pontibacter TaxID=323449 RepID=UPI00164D6C64|nr:MULTISPECIES: DUF4142 domain-containing protein [Pontibacter]MBC5775579.1 DUF4142 domain-containing protein [Pontibacter sp. KCTC 32443]
MKKTFLLFAAGALLIGSACTSTDTTTTDTTTDTTTTTGETTADDPTTTTPPTDTTTTTGTGAGGVTTTGGAATTMTNMDDATFLSTAASSNMMELQASKAALQKAKDPKVKEFAQMMIDHHTKASQDLKTTASQMGLTITGVVMPMHQKMIDELTNYTGTGYDEKYMDLMETAHKNDIAMFEAKSQNATNQAVKDFANRMTPTLRSHYEMATNIEDTVD